MRATRPKRPMVIVAAATGLRPAEWLALEWRDVDLDALGCLRPPLVRQGSVEVPEDRGEPPGVPLQTIALEAIGRQPSGGRGALVFPAERGGYLDPARLPQPGVETRAGRGGIEPSAQDLRSPPHLRHLCAPCRHLHLRPLPLTGRQPDQIDCHYGRLARDGRQHAIRLLDELSAGQRPRWAMVDAAWTPEPPGRSPRRRSAQQSAGGTRPFLLA
jgi:hypothetical protein